MAGVDFAGCLDPLILQQALQISGVEFTPERGERFRAAYLEELPVELERGSIDVAALPGALAAVKCVREFTHTTAGLLTGNYAPAAHLKLEHVGFDPEHFTIGAYGDMAGDRSALVPVAVQQFHELHGTTPEDVLIIGDTPRDVRCAHDNGCSLLAVATGRFSVEELRAAGAEHVVADLRSLAPLRALLGAPGLG